ncbi:SET domain-containing protein [Streptomyces paradoxus]|uniref:SET domain-containing protein n=1 Tax=Streptomyces paradoxus TaxID=66375 RepID=UPI003829D017
MLHPDLHPGLSPVGGSGVFALRDIPMGTALWGPCPDCEVRTAGEQGGLPPEVIAWLDEFGYRLDDRGLILPCGGAHLLNHSCEAVALDHGLAAGIAVRDIRAGEEVTCDYRTFTADEPWEFTCRCGTPSCAGTVRTAADGAGEALTRTWRQRMEPALAAARTLPQRIPPRPGSVLASPHAPAR